MPNHGLLNKFFKLLALLVVIASVLAALQPSTAAFSRGLDILMAASVAAVLWSVADLFNRAPLAPPELHANISRVQHQLTEFGRKIDTLETAIERLPRENFSLQAAGPSDFHEQFLALSKSIQDLREYALLPDADRRLKLAAHRSERKTVLLAEVYSHVAVHDWPAAERLLMSLSAEFPNDDEVVRGRHYLDHSRNLFAGETINRATAEIEMFLESGQIEKASEAVTHLASGFPGRGDIQNLMARVQREQINYVEATAKRLFDDVKAESDQRRWRVALTHAEKLTRQFPTHRLAESVRPKLATIKENAEIEQRQELEIRIGELIRDSKFDDAIELAEEVVRKYPDSPQAESLEQMLPRIRNMSLEQAGELHAADEPGA